MKEICTIISIENKNITVAPLSLEACMSCTSDCSHKGTTFTVTNPHKFELKTGMTVTIETKAQTQALQGILALFIPFACAIGLWLCAPFIAKLFGTSATEGLRALCVLTGLFVPALIILLVSRLTPPSPPHIVSC